MKNNLFDNDPLEFDSQRFDKHFTSVEKVVTRTIGAIVVIWGLWVILCLSILGGLIWAGIHFAAKYW